MYLLMILNSELLRFVFYYHKKERKYVNPLSLKHFVTIESMSKFISIQSINKWITKNYDTKTNNNEKEDVNIPIHQVQIPNKSKYQKRKSK